MAIELREKELASKILKKLQPMMTTFIETMLSEVDSAIVEAVEKKIGAELMKTIAKKKPYTLESLDYKSKVDLGFTKDSLTPVGQKVINIIIKDFWADLQAVNKPNWLNKK